MASEIRSSTNAMRKSALPQTEPNGVLPISTTILLVSVAVGESSDVTICGVLPMSICTAIVSPMARAIASTTAVRMPGAAAGTMTWTIVCHHVAPSARLASSSGFGTALSASVLMERIVGMIMMASTSEAASTPKPVVAPSASRRYGTSSVRPM